MDSPILVWPEFGPGHLIAVLVILVGLAVPFALLAIYRVREARRLSRWVGLSTAAGKRGLDLREMEILREFYESLTDEEQERISSDSSRYRSQLFTFLRANDRYDERREVRIIDKLFPDLRHWHAILSVRDLQPGEACALEFLNQHALATVIELEADMVTVSVAPNTPLPGPRDEVQLYAYRPQIGGFLLKLRPERTWRGGMRLLFLGDVEEQGDQHLMARVTLPIELQPWSERSGAPETDGEPNPEPPVRGTIERLSDRALLFVSTDTRLKQESAPRVWEMTTTIADGYQLSCRGRVIPARPGGSRYILRYLDLGENARHVLAAEIKRLGGEREQLV